jgi:hypothetical protein
VRGRRPDRHHHRHHLHGFIQQSVNVEDRHTDVSRPAYAMNPCDGLTHQDLPHTINIV